MKYDNIRKWAKDHKKNPNALVRLFKKLNKTETMIFLEEMKDEGHTKHSHLA
jgi:hypothetical protein